ncbi:centrosomal protein of 85 kDa-like isoform X1 [Dicentrarchus labrax]|uniref:Centrosomal protein of 85 kDa-like n=2 Tax=Dicentrarchus labrax TaxID=13489 RepID=A0A8C4DT43_DICLA|nr:centrosomal protein of 85 kDa-like isoform X1 [Dicentrarchus labrax]
MWYRNDFEDGYESNKTGSISGGSPGWIPGHESVWHTNTPGPGNSIFGGRRHSTVSDSGDTGIGTYCSDSLEDDSSSSTTPLSCPPQAQHHLHQDDDDGIPIVHVMPSPSLSPCSSFRIPPSPSRTNHSSGSCQLFMPAMSPLDAPCCLDMKDHQPIRRWSSLTKLSSGADKSCSRTSGNQYNPGSQGSLDRGLRYGYRKEPLGSTVDLYLPLSSSLLCHSLLQRSPGSGPYYQYHSSRATGLDTDLSLSSALSSPVKHNSLDMNYSALSDAKLARGGGQVYGLSLPKQADSPLGHQTDRGSPIQTAFRTQMWLTEQMEYRPTVQCRGKSSQINTGTEGCSADGLSPWQQGHQKEPGLNQMLIGTTLPVNTLVKVKEGLLRQRELEIDRQKQQILQLHARIRENELRAQQVLQSQRGWFDDVLNTKESAMRVPCKQPSDEELGRKLSVVELEVLHLNEFFQQATQKYTEDIRKLEEKIKTRDRYISSLKKKCQRESEQNQEKQQRIETLEKYLSDLPTLDEVQAQSRQQEELQQKAKDLEKTMSRLQKSLEEGCALMKEKNIKIEMQAKREKELIASVHSLQKKVQQCLDDGVRLPMQDLKLLEVENTQLLEQQDHSSMLIEHQKEQIERLTSQLTATSTRLQKKRGLPHRRQSCLLEKEESLATPPTALPQQVDDGLLVHPLSHVEIPEMGRLLKEMSLCLLDLQALCSILAQRAQGKEPNLSVLLGMKSLSVSAEEGDCREKVEDELRFKLLEVSQLRRDIDGLRKTISDCYAQYMGDLSPPVTALN